MNTICIHWLGHYQNDRFLEQSRRTVLCQSTLPLRTDEGPKSPPYSSGRQSLGTCS